MNRKPTLFCILATTSLACLAAPHQGRGSVIQALQHAAKELERPDADLAMVERIIAPIRVQKLGALPGLVVASRSSSESVRMLTASLLGDIKSERADSVLLVLAKDRSLDVQILALQTLGQRKSKRAIPILISALEGRGVGAASLALFSIGDPEGIRALKRLLDAPLDSRQFFIGIGVAGRSKAPWARAALEEASWKVSTAMLQAGSFASESRYDRLLKEIHHAQQGLSP